MFDVGQTVLYGSNGVCTIDDVTEKRIGKVTVEYYVLKPVYTNSSTLFVPTSNQKLVNKMRCVLTKAQAAEILDHIPECDEWIDSKLERNERFKEIIAEADCVELIKLIRLIHSHEQEQIEKGKRLHISDERFLKEAERMICEEFSIALDIGRDEVLARIL